MKTSISTVIAGIFLIASTSVFAGNSEINDSMIENSSQNLGTINSSIGTSSTLVSTGAVHLHLTDVKSSQIINSTINDHTVNSIEDGSNSTVTTGSITTY
jgi:hypothetical protein